MPHPLQATIDRLPALLERNAPKMMRRIVAHMKAELGRSSQDSDNAAHALLLLKVAEEDLVVSFVSAVQHTFAPKDRGMFDPSIPLSLEPETGNEKEAGEFEASDAAFAALCQCAAALGVHGTERYKNNHFLIAMKEAFAQARMDQRATAALMPHARAALDAELRALYAQLEAMASRQA